MISFKKFIEAIHSAISESSDKLVEKNREILDEYFVPNAKGNLVPKTVTLDYPDSSSISSGDDYTLVFNPIEVPLITLVPLTFHNIEKATFTAEFEMDVINDVLQIDFKKPRTSILRSKSENNLGKIEITLTPHQTPEGLQSLIDSYENFLKRQIT